MKLKRWLVVAGLLAGVVLLALVVLPRFVDVERYRPLIERELSKATGSRVELGRIELSVWGGVSLEVRPVGLTTPDGALRVAVPRLVVDASLMPLLRGEVRVEDVRLVEPSIELIRTRADAPMLPVPVLPDPTTEGASRGPAVSVRRVQVDSGRLVWEDRTQDPPSRIELVDVNLEVLLESGEISGNAATAGGGRLTWDGREGRTTLRLEDVDVDVPAALAAPGLLHPGGRLDGELSLGADAVEGVLRGRKLHLVGAPQPLPELRADLRIVAVPPAAWRAERLDITGGGATVGVSGDVWPTTDLAFELTETPLAPALALARGLFVLPVEATPPGQVRARGRIRGGADDTTRIEASGVFGAASLRVDPALPSLDNVTADFRLSRDGRFELEVREGQVAGGPLRATIRVPSIVTADRAAVEARIDGAALGTLLGGLLGERAAGIIGAATIETRLDLPLAATGFDPGSLGGSLVLGTGEVELPGWNLREALEARLVDRLGSLGEVAAALTGRDTAAATPAPTGGTGVLDRLEAELRFDGPSWSVVRLELLAGDFTATGSGSFDPRSGAVDVALDTLLAPQATTELVAAHRELRRLVDKTGRLAVPLRVQGALIGPSIQPDLSRLLEGTTGTGEKDDAVKGLLRDLIRRRKD